MRFKSLMLSVSLLASAAVFTYCTKETPVQEETPVVNTDNGEANDRGVCKALVTANGWNIDVCGTQNSFVQCGTTGGGVNLFGSATILNGNNQLFIVNTPTSLLISRNTVGPVVNVTATVQTTNSTVNYFVPAFGSVQVDIDDTCNQ